MVIRTRSRKGKPIAGTFEYWGSSAWQTLNRSVDTLVESVTDEVAPGNGLRFDVGRLKFAHGVPTVTGKAIDVSGRFATAKKFPIGRCSDLTFGSSHLTIAGVPTDAAAATELVSKTNPSRPVVDIPVFAAELRELPQLMLKRSGDIGRDISSGRLSAEFGWKPLLGDIKTLLDFQKHFDDRVRELTHLDRSGIRRKRKLFTGSSVPTAVYNGPLEWTRSCKVDGIMTAVTRIEVWGFCRWRPTRMPSSILGFQHNDRNLRALSAIAGINPYLLDASTLWELIPFSWLADWCSNAGDYLASQRNIVGASVYDVQIMRRVHTEVSTQITGVTPGFQVDTPVISVHNDTLYRRPISTLTVEAHFPFLNERKVAILSDVIHGSFNPRRVGARL